MLLHITTRCYPTDSLQSYRGSLAEINSSFYLSPFPTLLEGNLFGAFTAARSTVAIFFIHILLFDVWVVTFPCDSVSVIPIKLTGMHSQSHLIFDYRDFDVCYCAIPAVFHPLKAIGVLDLPRFLFDNYF